MQAALAGKILCLKEYLRDKIQQSVRGTCAIELLENKGLTYLNGRNETELCKFIPPKTIDEMVDLSCFGAHSAIRTFMAGKVTPPAVGNKVVRNFGKFGQVEEMFQLSALSPD